MFPCPNRHFIHKQSGIVEGTCFCQGRRVTPSLWHMAFDRGHGSATSAQTSQSCEGLFHLKKKKPPKKQGGRHGRAGLRLRRGPQTRQAAAGKLHQSVINEPTGRWDYMPNCTSNPVHPEMSRQHQLVSMTQYQRRALFRASDSD